MDEYKLVLPSMEYAEQIVAFRNDLVENGSSMDGTGALKRTADPEEFIAETERDHHEETLRPGRVCATVYMCVRKSDNKVVGMIQIRHVLNEYLTHFGGHIGYCVMPSERRKGIATAMLKMGLEKCMELGIERVLITCIRDNIGSEKTILACGGEFESTVYSPADNLYIKRFWIG